MFNYNRHQTKNPFKKVKYHKATTINSSNNKNNNNHKKNLIKKLNID